MLIDSMNTHKKNVDNLLRLRLLRYRQTPMFLKLVNAHAMLRELLLQFLKQSIDNFGDLSEDKNLKVDVQILYVLFILYLSAHRHRDLKGSTIHSFYANSCA